MMNKFFFLFFLVDSFEGKVYVLLFYIFLIFIMLCEYVKILLYSLKF